ncbi:hypothetical protein Taro_055751 [Colocasia esculenta]|uniref:Uncharacterized protein n=1 Tax=Colocasia esculenta TaxID=4460 RepID=A0A843XV85_COLES|nr:hypothetical protein [Colocasia esculenta]
MISPVINFWWPSLPANLSQEAFRRHPPGNRRTFWIAHHAPWLFYGYMAQKLVTPPAEFLAGDPDLFSRQDKEILRMVAASPTPPENKATQQGVHESLHRDIMVGFGRWEFDPLELGDPFPGGEGAVHIWQGAEDRLISAELQRHVAGRLPWVSYHECSDCGHLMVHLESCSNAILRTLVLGEEAVLPGSTGK